jgi:biopolymer transport protein ExbB
MAHVARHTMISLGSAAAALALSASVVAQETAPVTAATKLGLMHALQEGGPVAIATFVLMVLMSVGSWYIMITKYLEQRTILNQATELDKKFWTSNSITEGAGKLTKNSAFKQIVDDGLRAAAHHDGKLTDKIDQHEWITMSLQRATDGVSSKLQNGLAFLATVGSTAPFVGLFGTVVGIYNALLKIAGEGQATIDVVAGPVGEALIMTAIGLFVAVPAVMGYNLLIRRNKSVIEKLGNFSNDIHAFLMSGSRVAGK